jgi:hypothetical protein
MVFGDGKECTLSVWEKNHADDVRKTSHSTYLMIGCPKKKIRFGRPTDFDAGKNMFTSCEKYQNEKAT